MPVSAYLRAGLFVVAAAAALFAAAGTVAIPGFWAYLAIFAVFMIVSFAALDPDLLRERMRPGGKKPPLALRVFSLVLFMHWIVAGLDRGRFHWSDDVPGWLQGICLFTVAAGYALALWAMRVNRFFSSVIRIQTDRGQHVVTTGPYAFVRHPGYTAGILIIAASGLALGSWSTDMNSFDPHSFASQWIASWNARNVEGVLFHFRDDCWFESPIAKTITGNARLNGKEQLRSYWNAALAQIKTLRFVLQSVTWDASNHTLAVFYQSHTDAGVKACAELMAFDNNGKQMFGRAYYGAAEEAALCTGTLVTGTRGT